MRKQVTTILPLVGFLLAMNTYAGTDPIAWSISPSDGLPATTNLGSTYSVAYTMTNNLPFSVPLTVSGKYMGSSFAVTNRCNKTLAPKGQSGSSCTVHIAFQPIKIGQSSAQLVLAYHNNRVPLPALYSTASSVETNEKISGHVTTPLPATTYTGTNYPVTFTFVNNGTSSVTATAVNIAGFSPTSNTCTSALAPSSTCAVSGSITPSSVGSVTLGATYIYNGSGGSVSVPLSTQTIVQNGSGPCHHISAIASLPFPSNSFIYADNVVQYTFTNNCDTGSETLGTVSITSDATSTAPTLNKGTDNCSGKTISANSTCTVYESVIPNSTTGETNDLTLTASVPFDSNTEVADASTSEVVNAISNQGSLHTMMFVNQCNQNVWYGFQNGSGSGKSPDPTPSGSRTWSGYQLNQQLTGAAPSTKVLQFSAYNGGSIVGRTGCDVNPQSPTSTYGVCVTGNCTSLNNSTGTCGSSAPTNPATIFEEDIVSTAASDGVYDISLINGFNIPGEFRSMAPTVTPLNFTNACGISSGAIIPQSGSSLPACPWTFTPPSSGTDCTAGTATDDKSNYYYVSSAGTTACTAANASVTCAAGQVCGMAWTAQPSSNPQYLGTPIKQVCGTFQGYWTVADWINYTSSSQWSACNLYSHYSLNTTIDSIKPASQPTYGTFNGVTATLANVYGCQITSNGSLDSGYKSNPPPLIPSNVCGCHNWNDPNNFLTPQASNCQNDNSVWENNVFNRIQWLKQGCPTAYSYQFDDTSSQFTCNNSGQMTAYQISYCPGGVTGVPS